jgi:hypothetical protein
LPKKKSAPARIGKRSVELDLKLREAGLKIVEDRMSPMRPKRPMEMEKRYAVWSDEVVLFLMRTWPRTKKRVADSVRGMWGILLFGVI